MRNLRLKMGLQFYPGSTLSLARALSVATATLTHIEKEEKATNNEKIIKKSKGKNQKVKRRHDHQENVIELSRAFAKSRIEECHWIFLN